MASQSACGDAESDAESDRSDCEAVIDVTTQRSSALKFERAINKCVKVASAKVLQPTEHNKIPDHLCSSRCNKCAAHSIVM